MRHPSPPHTHEHRSPTCPRCPRPRPCWWTCPPVPTTRGTSSAWQETGARTPWLHAPWLACWPPRRPGRRPAALCRVPSPSTPHAALPTPPAPRYIQQEYGPMVLDLTLRWGGEAAWGGWQPICWASRVAPATQGADRGMSKGAPAAGLNCSICFSANLTLHPPVPRQLPSAGRASTRWRSSWPRWRPRAWWSSTRACAAA